MGIYELVAGIVTLAAVFSFINYRFFRLPTTIGVMIIAQVVSLGLLLVGYFQPAVLEFAKELMGRFDFDETLLQGMLGALLFAGALHVDWNDLKDQLGIVGVLASIGVIISMIIIAGLLKLGTMACGIELPWIVCFVFGALISPTDPIAVLSLLKQVGAPKWLETQIAGESLFNDGVGVVLFLGLVEVAFHGHPLTFGSLAILFAQEAIGGGLFGLLIGLVAFAMLRRVDNYQVEVLISLAVALGGYALAMALHISGPIAMVVAGLFLGNHGRAWAMSPKTNEHLDKFWELIDEILNAVLFVLLGLELLIVDFNRAALLLGLAMIVAVLIGRTISVHIPLWFVRRFGNYQTGTSKILIWGGLRGAISVALALSLPKAEDGVRELLLTITYVVVTFSIIVQGLTIGKLMSSTELVEVD